jgi:hypothetical protein
MKNGFCVVNSEIQAQSPYPVKKWGNGYKVQRGAICIRGLPPELTAGREG